MQTRALPTEQNFEALFRPDPERFYLEGADEHPFVATRDYAPRNAWWLAELSMLCYVVGESVVRAHLTRAGRSDVEIFDRRGTHCIVAGNLVAFRGTADLEDVLADLDARLVPEGTGQAHRGFVATLDPLWDELVEILGEREVWLTGHSMGGALAVLAAARLGDRARAVYTFGAPRVGDKDFAGALETPVYRIVNNNDLVTRLPPPVGYRHVGELKYMSATGEMHDEPGVWERVKAQAVGHGLQARDNVRRWLSGELDALAYGSLIDHSPVHYAVHMWNHYVASTRA